jgi:predicted NBD/HSP70 family sugar kinase
MTVDSRQQEILRHLWVEGPLSRSELHTRTAFTPNGVGTLAESLLKAGLIRERPAEPSTGGRPRVPLEIDPGSRHVIGLAINPGHVEIARIGLRGQLMGAAMVREVDRPGELIKAATALLSKALNRQSLAMGMSVTGFVDPEAHNILFSSATAGLGTVGLQKLYDRAGELPVFLGNDMHACAARWMLTHRAPEADDALIVSLEDGAVGASILIEGRPNRGCVTAANEIGHSRFPVETAKCYCGHTGCLERIFSSDFLARRGSPARLGDRIAGFDGSNDPALSELIKYLSMGLANVVNFVRPCRLVFVSRFMRFPVFADAIVRSTRSLLLATIAERVNVDFWDEPAANTAETAGWLALAAIFYRGWTSPHANGSSR